MRWADNRRMESLPRLYEDESLVAIDKPAGMLSVPGRGEAGRNCVAARVQAALPDALVVHRLDQATSGVMLFGRGAPAQRALSIAFAERRVAKRYEAIVHGLVRWRPAARSTCHCSPTGRTGRGRRSIMRAASRR